MISPYISNLNQNQMNYRISLQLNKLKKLFTTEMKGNDGQPVPCLVIPLDENPAIRISDRGGIFLNLTAWANKKKSSFGSHFIKTSALSKEQRESMTVEEMNEFDYIIGNMKPMETTNTYKGNGMAFPGESTYSSAISSSPDDMPF